MTAPAELSTAEIRERVGQLGEWFHNLDLRGVPTAPGHALGDYPSCKWRRFAHALPADLRGKTVLDIGCNAGFFAIEMKKRGADRVLGIDNDDGYLAQARFAAEVIGVDIELAQMSVYEVARLEETFDLVLFMGVFYHLRHPLLALDLIHEHVARDLFVFQSMLRGARASFAAAPDYPFAEEDAFAAAAFPRMCFIERSFAGDPTNWWIPNRACVEALLRSSGFAILDNPEEEVFVCRRERGRAPASGELGPDGLREVPTP
jgi:tRNA (mo5U34)-methyltransferase